MRVVVQRVTMGSVSINERVIASIGKGLMLLVGIGPGDDSSKARYLAEKIANLRVFEDSQGKTNLSLKDIGGEVVVVSQFTLYADTKKGRRPSFIDAAPPDIAQPLVDKFVEFLRGNGVPTQIGEFGAYMQVALINDGPMTIILER